MSVGGCCHEPPDAEPLQVRYWHEDQTLPYRCCCPRLGHRRDLETTSVFETEYLIAVENFQRSLSQIVIETRSILNVCFSTNEQVKSHKSNDETSVLSTQVFITLFCAQNSGSKLILRM